MRDALFVCVCVLGAGVANAQTAATLTVRVSSADGVPVSGALVVISGPSGEQQLTTDDGGVATTAGLAPGGYVVIVAADGAAPVTAEALVATGPVELAVQVDTAAGGEQIEIEDKAPERPRDPTKYVLSRDELRTSAGTNGDALLAIQNLPGVSRPPVQTNGLVVRGGAPEDTAIFVDGTSIPLAYHFGGVNSVLPVEALDRISFVPGNFGPQYGRALAGVVDLGLRSPRRDGLHGLVQLDAFDGRLFVETPLGSRARMFAGARRSWVDAWFGSVLESAGVGVTSAPVYYDAQGLLEVDVSRSTTARLAVFGASDKLRVVVASPMASDPVGGALGVGAAFWRLQGRVETKRGAARWVNTLSYGNETRNIEAGTTSIQVDVDPIELRSQLDFQLTPTLAAIAGLDLAYQRGNISLRVPPTTDPAAPSPTFGQPAIVFDRFATLTRPGIYAGLEWVALKGLDVYPSLRVDYSSDGGDTRVSPRLTGRWRTGAVAVKGGIGIYAQPPQPGQAADGFGNPSLRNGVAMQFGAGVERMFGDTGMVSSELFGKRLSDLPVETPAAGEAAGSVIENTGSGFAYGIELLARKTWDARSSISVAYTYARSKRRDDDMSTLTAFELDQPHTLNVLAATKLGSRWTVSGRFRYSSGQPFTPLRSGIVDLDSGAYGAIPGGEASERLPAFHQLDLRIERAFRTKIPIDVYLDVQNAYNRSNSVARGYNYRYTRSVDVSGLPILPILGIRGEL